MVVFPPVVGVFGHEEPALLLRVTRSALRPLSLVRVVLGTEGVHQFMDEVEDGHPQRYPSLLEGLHADEQTVEAVGLLVQAVPDIITKNFINFQSTIPFFLFFS